MLQVPIIAPIKAKKAELLEQQPLKTNYNNEFLSGMMTNPELIRNVAVVGHLHHGKTLVRLSYLCVSAHCVTDVHQCLHSRHGLRAAEQKAAQSTFDILLYACIGSLVDLVTHKLCTCEVA